MHLRTCPRTRPRNSGDCEATASEWLTNLSGLFGDPSVPIPAAP